MYDEYTRAWDGWLAHLAYLEEKEEEAVERGVARGIEQGIEQGRLRELVSLVKEGLISKEVGAKKLNISEREFEKYLQ